MNKTMNIAFSALLICACFFGLIGGAATMVDISRDKDYWEDVRDEARVNAALLQDGVNQLMVNQQAYLDGLEEYKDGVAEYNQGLTDYEEGSATLDEKRKEIKDGEQQLADGKAMLEWSREQLNDGYKQYYEGVAQLEDSIAKLDAAKAELAAREPEYLEGKQRLEAATPIYNTVLPLNENYQNTKQQYEAALASGDLQTTAQLYVSMLAQEAMLNAELKGYSINGIIEEYESGLAQINQYEDGLRQVQEGEAAVAAAQQKLNDAMDTLNKGENDYAEGMNKYYTNEDKLNEGKKLFEEGEKDLAEGKEKLSEGEEKLGAGAAQLEVYQDGERRLADGLDQSIATDTWYTTKGVPVIPSIADRLGADFTYWAVENDRVVRKNGQEFIDLAKAQRVVDTTTEFIDDTEDTVTKELTTRTIVTLMLVVASVVGICAAVFGLVGNRKMGFIFALASTVITLATVFVGIGLGECTMSQLAGGFLFNLVVAEIILLAASIIFAVSQVLTVERAA